MYFSNRYIALNSDCFIKSDPIHKGEFNYRTTTIENTEEYNRCSFLLLISAYYFIQILPPRIVNEARFCNFHGRNFIFL